MSQERLQSLLSLVINEQVERYLSSLATMAAGLERISGVVTRLEQQTENVSRLGNSSPMADIAGQNSSKSPTRLVKIGAHGESLADSAAQWDALKDSRSGLLWSSGPEPMRTYDWFIATELRAKGLILCGLPDWRVPTLKELETLYEAMTHEKDKGSLFLNGAGPEIWSSTSSAARPGYAWVLDFYTGEKHIRDKLDFRHTRLVHSVNIPLR